MYCKPGTARQKYCVAWASYKAGKFQIAKLTFNSCKAQMHHISPKLNFLTEFTFN